jgi:hypothetical protein
MSATEPSQLILCKIRGFHGGDYEEYRLLGCGAVWALLGPMEESVHYVVTYICAVLCL